MKFKETKKLERNIVKNIDEFIAYYRSILILAFIAGVLIFLGWTIVQGPIYLVNQRINVLHQTNNALTVKERLDEENSFRATFAQIIGGLAIITGLYFSFRNIKIAESNIEIAKDGKITDRYTKAIEQLASEKQEIRLGGIYALERIARESSVDHTPIIEVLCAYLRSHSPAPEDLDEHSVQNTVHELRPEIQTIIQVLGRRIVNQNNQEYKLNLDWLYLGDIILQSGNFESASFFRAYLPGCDFEKSILDFAHFQAATLNKCDFTEAKMREAVLDFSVATKAKFNSIKARGISLQNANFTLCIFNNSDLRDANMDNANMTLSSFQSADLRGANFRGTDLTSVNLVHADIRGVDLSEALGLTMVQVNGAVKDQKTKLPDYLTSAPSDNPVQEQD